MALYFSWSRLIVYITKAVIWKQTYDEKIPPFQKAKNNSISDPKACLLAPVPHHKEKKRYPLALHISKYASIRVYTLGQGALKYTQDSFEYKIN